MSYNLFLDDERFPQDVTWVDILREPYVIVRNYREFTDTILQKGVPDYVTFDHDLAEEHYIMMEREIFGETVHYGVEPTGYECAVWLYQYCVVLGVSFPEYQVHSKNPIGSKRIRDLINSRE